MGLRSETEPFPSSVMAAWKKNQQAWAIFPCLEFSRGSHLKHVCCRGSPSLLWADLHLHLRKWQMTEAAQGVYLLVKAPFSPAAPHFFAIET